MAELPQRAKAHVGTPLRRTALLTAEGLTRLRALGVTTVEEVLGLISADPQRLAAYLGVEDVDRLQASVAAQARRAEVVLGATPERRATGARLTPDAPRAATLGQATEPSPTGSVDLREHFGPVRYQGTRGTCVAHAVGGAVEFHDRASDISEQFLYWAAKRHDDDQDEGTFVKHALEGLAADGVCSEAAWPYSADPVPGNESQGPPPADAIAEALANRWHGELVQPMPSVLRSHLDAGLPVAVCIPVFENWYGNPAVELFGLFPMPLPGSEPDTGHAMLAVGYGTDDDFPGGGYFVLRNSWGTSWAVKSPVEAGYGLIPMAFIEQYAYEAGVIHRRG